MHNQDEVTRLLEEMEKQLLALQAILDKAQAIVEGVDTTWSDEEEAQYRMRHAS